MLLDCFIFAPAWAYLSLISAQTAQLMPFLIFLQVGILAGSQSFFQTTLYSRRYKTFGKSWLALHPYKKFASCS